MYVKAQKERFLQWAGVVVKIHVVVWQTTSKNYTNKRAARAARLLVPHSTNHIV